MTGSRFDCLLKYRWTFPLLSLVEYIPHMFLRKHVVSSPAEISLISLSLGSSFQRNFYLAGATLPGRRLEISEALVCIRASVVFLFFFTFFFSEWKQN